MAGLTARPNEDQPLAGITLMLLACLFFSCIDASAKWLSLAALPVFQIAFMRFAGHFAISFALICRGGLSPARFGARRPLLVLLRGLLLLGATGFNFMALRYIPLTLTSTIMFSAPIIICALSGPLLGEKVGVWRWGAIAAGFVGVLIAVRPFDADFHWAVLLSLITTFCYALYTILTRKLAGQVATDTLQLYSGAVGLVALAPFAIAEWQQPASTTGWILLSAIGFFGWLGHELMTRAHGKAGASTLTPFSYALILFMTLWSWLVFNEPPDRWTLLAAAIIVTSGLVIWFREHRLGVTHAE